MTALGLSRVSADLKKEYTFAAERARIEQVRREDEARTHIRIAEGLWHDGRLDCIAGNGVMSELGIGDESFGEDFAEHAKTQRTLEAKSDEITAEKKKEDNDEIARRQRSAADLETIQAMPIVIIRGFESKGGGIGKEDLLDVLTEWAARLAENKVCRHPSEYERIDHIFLLGRSCDRRQRQSREREEDRQG